MRLLLRHKSEYASWVRSFTWTMCLHRACATTTVALEDDRDSVIQLFSQLDCALSVDINGGSIHRYPPKPVPALFPAASHIRLSGQMHYGLASAILHGPQKTQLKTLDICNLHERGHTQSRQNYQTPPVRESYGWGVAAWEDDVAAPIEEDWPEGSLPKQVPPGPMRRLLNKQLVTRCTSLERLALRQVGIDMLQSFKILPPGWYYPGPEIHEEWTSFIRAVRPRHLILQYDDLCSKT